MTMKQALAAITSGHTDQGIQGLKSLFGTTDEALARFNLGLIYKGEEKLLDALEEFEKAATLEPSLGEIQNEIGLVHDALGRSRRALECYRKALELNPELPSAWNNLGVIYFLKQDFTLAREYFEKAVALDPEMASAWYNLRDTCEELGDTAGASLAENQWKKWED